MNKNYCKGLVLLRDSCAPILINEMSWKAMFRSLSSQTPQPLDDATVKEFQNYLGCLESKGRKMNFSKLL